MVFDMEHLKPALIFRIKLEDRAGFQVNLDIHLVIKDPTLSNFNTAC